MTRMILTALTALGILVAGAGVASADRVDRRQRVQQDRIAQGVESGELRPGEARRLRREQRRIKRLERRARRDGRMNRAERRRMGKAQDRASRHIYRHKHDCR